jgi:hypothetical protein
VTLFRFPDPDAAADRWARAGGLREQARRRTKLWLHRRGWIASPSLSFMNVPFGPDRRDLAGEVLRAVGQAVHEREVREAYEEHAEREAQRAAQ